MSNLYKLVSRWLITFSIPVSLIFIFYPVKVMLLFGADYMDSASVLVLLTIATFIQTTLGAAGPVLSMSGFTRLVFWNSLGTFILNLILNIILIPKFGIMGAAWATLISLSMIGLVRIIEVQFILKLSLFSKNLFKPFFAGLITIVFILSTRPFIIVYHTVVTLSFALISSILIYGLILYLLKLESEDKYFWSGLILFRKKGIVDKS
jgi:O-antigen/teichoic acid export membrane protein